MCMVVRIMEVSEETLQRKCSSKKCRRMTTGKYAQCATCREIKKKSSNRPEAKKIHREAQARHYKTDKFEDTRRRHMKTDKWKANRKRARVSEKGVLSVQRASTRRREMIQADPGMKLAKSLGDAASRISGGRTKSSRVFVSNTSFKSVNDYRNHMASFFNDTNGFSWSTYGTLWENEHRIPVHAYDHTNAEDVRRCWSRENMRPHPPLDNQEKGNAIVYDDCSGVPHPFRPCSWNGIIPCEVRAQSYSSFSHRYEACIGL